MAKRNGPQLNTLMKAIERAVEAGVVELGYELEAAYGRSIDRFYKDYPFPKYYSRTYSLYAGSDAWDNPLKNMQRKGRNKFYIGINVGPENIYPNLNGSNFPYDDVGYRDGVDFVFGRSFEQGIHGMTPDEATKAGLKWHKKPMSPPPKHFMDKEYKKIGDNAHLDELFGRNISRELSRLK